MPCRFYTGHNFLCHDYIRHVYTGHAIGTAPSNRLHIYLSPPPPAPPCPKKHTHARTDTRARTHTLAIDMRAVAAASYVMEQCRASCGSCPESNPPCVYTYRLCRPCAGVRPQMHQTHAHGYVCTHVCCILEALQGWDGFEVSADMLK